MLFNNLAILLCLAFLLCLAYIAEAYQPGTHSSSLYGDRYRKGDDTVDRYVASSFNDSTNVRESNGTHAKGDQAATIDLGNDVAVRQLDAYRSADEVHDLYQLTKRYEAYLDANRIRHNLDAGNVLERNDAILTPDRAKQRRARVEQLHNDMFEHDDATRQQNKTTSEFGPVIQNFRAAKAGERKQSRVAISPESAAAFDRTARDAVVDETTINSRTRWNILERERATGQTFDDRLRYNFDESDIAL